MIRRVPGWSVAVAGLAAAGALGWLLLRDSSGGAEVRATLSVRDVLSGADTVGWARAVEPRAFRFPEDHGPHPAFRTEWWYFTGNLEDQGGRRFGYQMTIFRSALRPAPPEAGSAWSTNQAYMGHLALTDAGADRFRAWERFERDAVGLAGARSEPVRVWVGGWEVAGSPPTERSSHPPGEAMAGSEGFPFVLTAAAGAVRLELRLDPIKPVVLQGDRGLSQKGAEAGNASYYHSWTRLATEGTVTTEEGRFTVTGTSWLDREWGTSALSAGQVGWDWFALQLDDGRELMMYALRREDGSADPLSEGVLVEADGATVRLPRSAFSVEPTGRWSSPRDGATYPSGWRVTVPSAGLDLRVDPVLEDQELDLAFRYWEGAVDVRGTASGRPVAGRGYVELTGYAAEPPDGR